MNRNVIIIAVFSFFSRVLTFVGRTLYLGHFGAAHPFLNAFVFALQVPQVLFNVVGTALSTVFIPIYNSLLAEEKTTEANAFINHVLSLALALLVGLTVLGMLGAPWIARVVGGAGFDVSAQSYLVFSLRVLLPGMVFFGVGAVLTGVLQSHGNFRLPALVTAPAGVLLVGYMIFFAPHFGVRGLVFLTLIGVVLQPVLLIAAVWRLGYRFHFHININNPHIRTAGKLCVPVLVSAISYQAHFLFAHAMALRLGIAAVLDYAQQLVQVLIMLIVLAVAQVYLPALAKLWAKKAFSAYSESLRNAFVYTLFLVMPTTLGLLILQRDIMALLLGDNTAGLTAGRLMALYAPGLLLMGLKEIADRGFYAKKDARTPAIAGVIMMVLNIGITWFLIPHIGYFAMPVAYFCAALCGTAGLLISLHKKTPLFTRAFILDIVKIVIASIVMTGIVFFIHELLTSFALLLRLIISALAGICIYFSLAWIMRFRLLQRG